MHHVIKKLAFRGFVMVDPLISWTTLDFAMTVDMLIRGWTIWRTGSFLSLPLADHLPCV